MQKKQIFQLVLLAVGAVLAAVGKKVLLIDLDSQASLTISVGLEPLEAERTVVDMLRKDGPPAGLHPADQRPATYRVLNY